MQCKQLHQKLLRSAALRIRRLLANAAYHSRDGGRILRGMPASIRSAAPSMKHENKISRRHLPFKTIPVGWCMTHLIVGLMLALALAVVIAVAGPIESSYRQGPWRSDGVIEWRGESRLAERVTTMRAMLELRTSVQGAAEYGVIQDFGNGNDKG